MIQRETLLRIYLTHFISVVSSLIVNTLTDGKNIVEMENTIKAQLAGDEMLFPPYRPIPAVCHIQISPELSKYLMSD